MLTQQDCPEAGNAEIDCGVQQLRESDPRGGYHVTQLLKCPRVGKFGGDDEFTCTRSETDVGRHTCVKVLQPSHAIDLSANRLFLALRTQADSTFFISTTSTCVMTPTLSDVPDEILGAILVNFCPHCTRAYDYECS